MIDNERATHHPRNFGWTDYYNLDEINEWLDNLVASHSDILTNLVIGDSYEGRPIRVLKLSHKEVRILFKFLH